MGGGEGLVKTILIAYPHDDKIQTWAKVVLDAIGADRHWTPKGAEAREGEEAAPVVSEIAS